MIGCYHAAAPRQQRTGMKSIFVDCNNQLDAVFAPRASRRRSADHRPHRDVSVVRPAPPARRLRHLSRRPLLYADRDHGPVPRPPAHRISRHRRVELHGRSGARPTRHHGAHHQGLRRHRSRRAHGGADVRRCALAGPDGPRHPRRHLGAARRHAVAGQDARPDRPRRHRTGSRPDRPRHRHGGDRLEPLAAAGGRRARSPISTPCWRPPTWCRCT